jgi:hypothetical protein
MLSLLEDPCQSDYKMGLLSCSNVSPTACLRASQSRHSGMWGPLVYAAQNLIKGFFAPSIPPGLYSRTGRRGGGPPTVLTFDELCLSWMVPDTSTRTRSSVSLDAQRLLGCFFAGSVRTHNLVGCSTKECLWAFQVHRTFSSNQGYPP